MLVWGDVKNHLWPTSPFNILALFILFFYHALAYTPTASTTDWERRKLGR